MTFKMNRFIDSLKISNMGSKDLINLMQEFISSLKQQPGNLSTIKEIRTMLYLFETLASTIENKTEKTKYFELMSVILSYYLDLEIRFKSNDKEFINIYAVLHRYLNKEFDIVKTLIHFFKDDIQKIILIKSDPTLASLFCQLFKRQFLNTREHSNIPSELLLFAYFFIYKFWFYLSSNYEEKDQIDMVLIPHLFSHTSKFLTTYDICILNDFYEEDAHILATIQSIQLKIQTLVPPEDIEEEKLCDDQIDYFQPECFEPINLPWIDKAMIYSSRYVITVSDYEDDENISMKAIASQTDGEIIQRISQCSTVPVVSPGPEDISPSFSEVSTVQLTTSNEESLSEYYSFFNSEDFNEYAKTNEAESTKVFKEYVLVLSKKGEKNKVASGSKSVHSVHYGGRIHSIRSNPKNRFSKLKCNVKRPSSGRIFERYTYYNTENDKNMSFAEYRAQSRDRKQNHYPLNGLMDVQVKVKKLDQVELELFKNKKLPLKYMENAYKNHSEFTRFYRDSKSTKEVKKSARL